MLMEADDITIFADEATSLARKEMMDLFVSAYEEKDKRVLVEFVSIATVPSTQSTILLDKIRTILTFLKLIFLTLMVPTQCLANILVTMNNEEFDTLHPFNLNQLPMSSVSIVLHASFWTVSVTWITGQASTGSVKKFLQ